MSDRHNLNLGRHLCLPAAVRKKYYIGMLAYLLFAGGVLIEGMFRVSIRLNEVRLAADHVNAVKARCAVLSGGETVPSKYMKDLYKRSRKQIATLESIGKQALPSIPFLPVLFEVQSALPAGIEFTSFSMSPSSFTISLQFSSACVMSPEAYLTQWRSNENLSRYLGPLEVESRKTNSRSGDDEVVSLVCTAKVKDR